LRTPGRPHLARVAPYVPGKPVEALERELGVRDAVKLASNENPLGPSPLALQAMARALTELNRYPDAGQYALRCALAARLGIGTDELAFGNGSNELIDLLCRTVAGEGDHAVIGAPSFACFALCLQVANVPTTVVPLRDGLYWDLEAMHAALRPETRLLFIDNPNNPTSTHVASTQLAAFLRALPESVTPVIDEAYAEFADAPDYQSALELRALHPRLVVLRTFSKAYGLAAARVGYAVANPELCDYLGRVRAPFNVNGPAQAGALAALDDAGHLERYLSLNRSERQRLARALGARGLEVAPSQTNFLCVRVPGKPAALYEALLREGVIVRPLPAPLSSHLRISLGTLAENERLQVALDRVLG
jgi:histidinol-phosphate aminotransferase